MNRVNYSSSESLGEQIANVLRLRIVSKESTPGTKISENQIAKEFETSRSPVRDALKILSNEGLIRLERMGAVVLGLNSTDLLELYEVRYLIETFAIKRLMENYKEDLIISLVKIIDKMDICGKHGDYKEFSELDFLFHETLIKGIEHNRINHLWNSMSKVVKSVILITTEKRFQGRVEEYRYVIKTHRQMIDVIKTRDVKHIDKVLKEHFNDGHLSIKNLL
ncbi:GntR family transcriptional regulator of gluconate operon [Evansella vedderi]|uniref:GntR family transcriptional regulator of gluconate operon n=1 Tax=Evansella vedderi TaxID=38282 RepID=A0ABT9ZNV5_9BACI|nr:GntR family transcriptional regulator [Evansella vedderi]MDQ0252921.1 GntR family transcriptional regulator of gluconate operon [Evansella vedderi]